MPSAVVTVDLEHIPTVIDGLDRYTRAFIYLQLRGRVVDHIRLPVRAGRLAGAEIHAAMAKQDSYTVWDRWLRNHLEWEEPGASATGVRATVAVCTRERPEDLERCLSALEAMPDDSQDIVVIDNAPFTNATQGVVARHPRARYVREGRLGLNAARNRALAEAAHEIVAFIDDDAVADPGWLRGLSRNFADPLVQCVTGLTLPLELETPAQEWQEILSPFGRGLARRVFDTTVLSPPSAGLTGAGVNMALRRGVPAVVGPFDEALDAGTFTRSGGDNEMFSRILGAGYRIVYDPAALSWHRHRRTWPELRQAFYGYGAGVYAAWTRSLLVERELHVLRTAYRWLLDHHLRSVARSLLRRPDSGPLDLVLAELSGCAAGPWAYLASRRRLRRAP